MDKTKLIAKAQGAWAAGRAQWGQQSHKGSALWLALLALACVAMWRLAHAPPQNTFERAQQRAAQAVEMELGGSASYSELSSAMTPAAAKRALADRTASGLEEALARSGSKINATATPVSVERTAAGWSVKGVALAKWEGNGPPMTGPWRGEWSALLVQDERGELRVTKLTVASQDDQEERAADPLR